MGNPTWQGRHVAFKYPGPRATGPSQAPWEMVRFSLSAPLGGEVGFEQVISQMGTPRFLAPSTQSR